MKGYSFRSLTDLVLKIFKTKVIAGAGLSGGGSLEEDITISVKYGDAIGTAAQGNDARLSNSREWIGETISQAEAEAGIAKTRRAFTSERVRQSIVKWWDEIAGSFGKDFITSTNAITARVKLGLGEHALRWPTWGEVTGKPSTFTPTSHTHPWEQITEKPPQSLRWPSWAEVTGKPDPWPVGVCYTQYPHTPTPAMLFGGTWKLLFANEGAFFRTEGVGASAFESGLQQDSLKSHRHDASSSGAGGHAHTGSTNATGNHAHSGSTSSSGSHSHELGIVPDTHAGGRAPSFMGDWDNINRPRQTGAAGAHTHSISTNTTGNHSHTVSTDTVANHTHAITVSNTGDGETRPTNRTIRVWQRIT